MGSLWTTLVVTFGLTEMGVSGTVSAIWGMMSGLLVEVLVLATGALGARFLYVPSESANT